MERNQYIPVMIQSLKKKSEILDTIMELNIRQSEELENPALDPDDLDKTVEEKCTVLPGKSCLVESSGFLSC